MNTSPKWAPLPTDQRRRWFSKWTGPRELTKHTSNAEKLKVFFFFFLIGAYTRTGKAKRVVAKIQTEASGQRGGSSHPGAAAWNFLMPQLLTEKQDLGGFLFSLTWKFSFPTEQTPNAAGAPRPLSPPDRRGRPRAAPRSGPAEGR